MPVTVTMAVWLPQSAPLSSSLLAQTVLCTVASLVSLDTQLKEPTGPSLGTFPVHRPALVQAARTPTLVESSPSLFLVSLGILFVVA